VKLAIEKETSKKFAVKIIAKVKLTTRGRNNMVITHSVAFIRLFDLIKIFHS
jgi:hypothetical protein